MRKSTILIISIMVMLLIAGNLIGFTQTVHTITTRNGSAIIKIYERDTTSCWYDSGTFGIVTGSNNTKYPHLNTGLSYEAEIEAWNGYAIVKRTIYFTEYTGPITFDIDLSGQDPRNPPAGH